LSTLPPDELRDAIQQGLRAPGVTLAAWHHSLDVLDATFQRVATHMTGFRGETVWRRLPHVYLRPYARAAARLRLGYGLPVVLLNFAIRAMRAWRGAKWKRSYTEARLLFDDPIFGIYRSLWEACQAVKADASLDPVRLEQARTTLRGVLHVKAAKPSWEEVIGFAARACDSYYGATWRARGAGGEIRIRSVD
jgi:hypothetical protein